MASSNKYKNPPNKGPKTVPARKLDSNLANFLVLLLGAEWSATKANAAGRVAEPIKPLINLPAISNGNNSKTSIKPCLASSNGVIKAIREMA